MKDIFAKMGKVYAVLVLALMLMAPFVSTFSVFAADPKPEAAVPGGLVYAVPVHQTIESGLQQFLNRAFADAANARASYIVLDINTLGGRIDTAEGIGELIRGSGIPVVAFIHGKAASAGSYIALNAGKIVMAPGSTIGAAAVVDNAGNEVTSAKIISHWASEMRAAAEMHGRNPSIAVGMVDKNTVVPMPELGRTAEKGEIVSLTAEEALKVGYADNISSDLNGVLEFLGAKDATVIDFAPSPAERLAQFLTNPAVSTILLLIGIAGVAIELFVPGFGLPGILGLAGFGLYFFGHYVAGFAGMEDIALFVIGIVLMIIEIFVSSFGLLGIAGILCLLSGVVMAAFNTKQALMSLTIAFLLAVVVVAVFVRLFKHRGVWNRFILKDEQKNEQGYTSAPPKQNLLGKTGKALTPLRPAGTAMIDGQRVDVVTEGEFLAPGSEIVVGHIEGTRVVVKEWKEH